MTALLGDLARVTDEWCCFPEGREKILVRVIDGEEEGSFRVVWRHLSRLEEGTSGPAPYLETPRHRLNDCALEYEEEVVPQGEGPLVLLVEDNLDFARIMKKLFKHHDIELVHAETGDMALGLLEASQRLPALVISDFHMPKMNGAFFIRQLRRMTRFKRTPVIMLTSDEQTDIEVHSIETGADAFIGKSENPKILFAHVMRFLEREGWVKEAAAL
jgi:CheY-like chemotaxis protein